MTIKLLAIIASMVLVYFIDIPIIKAIDHYLKFDNNPEDENLYNMRIEKP